MSSIAYIQFKISHNSIKENTAACAQATVPNHLPFTGQAQFQATQMVTPLKTMLTMSRNLS
jgi:hypothetical protein